MKEEEFYMKLNAEQVKWVADREQIQLSHRCLMETTEDSYRWLEKQNHAMQDVLNALLAKLPEIEDRGEILADNPNGYFLLMDKWYHKQDFIDALKNLRDSATGSTE